MVFRARAWWRLRSYADFARLLELLADRGVSDAGLDLLLGGNALALRRLAGG
jgi:hypothetical protein